MPEYNPYGNLEGWYGVPNYQNAYTSYVHGQAQPLPLARIVSMVRDIQQGMSSQPMGSEPLSVSPPTQAEIPAQVAANIMNTANRLLSLPRMRLQESSYTELPAGPEQAANAPASARTTKTTSTSGGGITGTSPTNVSVRMPQGMVGTPGLPSQPSGTSGARGTIQPQGTTTTHPAGFTQGPSWSPSGITASGKTAAGLRW